MNNIVIFINKLNKYNFKEINIEDDYDYYVHMNNRGKRCHTPKKDRTIENISNNLILTSDKHRVFTIDIDCDYRRQLKMCINGYWKILIILKLDEQDNIIDYSINFPYVQNEEFVKKLMRELFNEEI